jgi:hypothetical protein
MVQEVAESSFGKAVARLALRRTADLFRSRRLDYGLAAVGIPLAGFTAYALRGSVEAFVTVIVAIVALFGPLGIAFTGAFLWNLWLAPAELAYEAASAVGNRLDERASPRLPTIPPPYHQVNWEIWKRLNKYTLVQFASILTKKDPEFDGNSTEETAFRKLLCRMQQTES